MGLKKKTKNQNQLFTKAYSLDAFSIQNFKNTTVKDNGITPQTTEILPSQMADRPQFHSITASFLNTGGLGGLGFLGEP